MNYTKLTIKINSQKKPPYFVGSQLRGAFGYALKNINSELFNIFFEQKNTTHKYRFDIRLGLNVYEFSFYLFEDDENYIFDCITAFHEMFTNVGLGRNNQKFYDFDIFLNKKEICRNGKLNKIVAKQKEFKTSKYKKEIILRFDTPLRIKKDNKFVSDENIELDSILNSIYQRSLALENKEFKRLSFKPKYKIKSKDIFFNDLKRFSNIQNSSMQFGGIMGEMWISDLDERSYELLKLGELIGVGKQTVFGLGKITIQGVK